jgi:hypothetical protein
MIYVSLAGLSDKPPTFYTLVMVEPNSRLEHRLVGRYRV